jgi:hypothetical protein
MNTKKFIDFLFVFPIIVFFLTLLIGIIGTIICGRAILGFGSMNPGPEWIKYPFLVIYLFILFASATRLIKGKKELKELF